MPKLDFIFPSGASPISIFKKQFSPLLILLLSLSLPRFAVAQEQEIDFNARAQNLFQGIVNNQEQEEFELPHPAQQQLLGIFSQLRTDFEALTDSEHTGAIMNNAIHKKNTTQNGNVSGKITNLGGKALYRIKFENSQFLEGDLNILVVDTTAYSDEFMSKSHNGWFRPKTSDGATEHLLQYTSRNLLASEHRAKGNNTLVLFSKGHSNEAVAKALEERDFVYLSPKRFFSRAGFGVWSMGTYETPQRRNLQMGAINGSLQSAMTVFSLSIVHLLKSESFSTLPSSIQSNLGLLALSFTFGAVIGTFIHPYKNIVKRGTEFWRNVKGNILSYSFAISLALISEGIEPFVGVALFATMWKIAQNALANNALKTEAYSLPRIREMARITNYPWFMGINRSNWEFELIYLYPFTARLIQMLMIVGVAESSNLSSWLSFAGLWMLVPLSTRGLVEYGEALLALARKQNHDLPYDKRIDIEKLEKETERQRERWENLKRFLSLSKARKKVKALFSKEHLSAQEILKGMAEEARASKENISPSPLSEEQLETEREFSQKYLKHLSEVQEKLLPSLKEKSGITDIGSYFDSQELKWGFLSRMDRLDRSQEVGFEKSISSLFHKVQHSLTPSVVTRQDAHIMIRDLFENGDEIIPDRLKDFDKFEVDEKYRDTQTNVANILKALWTELRLRSIEKIHSKKDQNQSLTETFNDLRSSQSQRDDWHKQLKSEILAYMQIVKVTEDFQNYFNANKEHLANGSELWNFTHESTGSSLLSLTAMSEPGLQDRMAKFLFGKNLGSAKLCEQLLD
ncbi:hypothetical protein GW915_10310 [bacterium]|nr:hypothetical protein [bacterium]